MKTTKQALQEIMHEAHQKYRQVLEEEIATEKDEGNRAMLQQWKDNLSPDQFADKIDTSIANHLKRVQQTDPDFVFFKYEHHRKNPEEFDKMLQELERKGLM